MEDLGKNIFVKIKYLKELRVQRFTKAFKDGSSVAIMIDQRYQRVKKFYCNKIALTTTIPAQLVRRYNCKIVPVYVERKNNHYFNIEFSEPLNFMTLKI